MTDTAARPARRLAAGLALACFAVVGSGCGLVDGLVFGSTEAPPTVTTTRPMAPPEQGKGAEKTSATTSTAAPEKAPAAAPASAPSASATASAGSGSGGTPPDEGYATDYDGEGVYDHPGIDEYPPYYEDPAYDEPYYDEPYYEDPSYEDYGNDGFGYDGDGCSKVGYCDGVG